ncbi:MAG: outer membrane protein assembly factor BamE [Steroidobacteraceae bacterium]
MNQLALRTLLALMVALGASACVYRVNIQQGNFLTTETTDQLKEGMTRSQVRFLLGTPMVPDAFDNDRWDYLYTLQRGRLKKPERRQLIVYFNDDKVARFENNGILPRAASAGATRKPKVSLWRRLTGRGDQEPVMGPAPSPDAPPSPVPASRDATLPDAASPNPRPVGEPGPASTP